MGWKINDSNLIGVITSHLVQGCHYGLLITWKTMPRCSTWRRPSARQHPRVTQESLREAGKRFSVRWKRKVYLSGNLKDSFDSSCSQPPLAVSASEYLISSLNSRRHSLDPFIRLVSVSTAFHVALSHFVAVIEKFPRLLPPLLMTLSRQFICPNNRLIKKVLSEGEWEETLSCAAN